MCRGFNFEECAEVAFSINVKFCGMVSTMLYSIDDNLNHFEGSKFQCKQAKMQKIVGWLRRLTFLVIMDGMLYRITYPDFLCS